jgi:dTMP kinase
MGVIMRGKFIVIDGMDHSGKGVQLDLLKKKLVGRNILFTREPGGTPLGEELREILLRKNGNPSNPLADFFLFWSARGSHIEDMVEPHRQKGGDVITDRYDSSTNVFQIRAEQHPELEKVFWATRGALPPIYWPDAYIFFDLPAEVAYERGVRAKAKDQTRFDAKPLAYHERVQKGFQAFAREIAEHDPRTIVEVVNADRTIDEVHADVLAIVERIIKH